MVHNKRLTCGKSWLHLAISWSSTVGGI